MIGWLTRELQVANELGVECTLVWFQAGFILFVSLLSFVMGFVLWAAWRSVRGD